MCVVVVNLILIDCPRISADQEVDAIVDIQQTDKIKATTTTQKLMVKKGMSMSLT